MLSDRPRRPRAGFSLIELLIVIAIILIILAVSIPQLGKARLYAQEMAAQKAIGTIHTEQAQYYSQYGRYAASLAELGPPASGSPGANAAGLIDPELATGEKGNFKFTLQPSPDGYTITAVPVVFGTSGSHTYYSDQTMLIHEHEGREVATASDPFPGRKAPQTRP